MVRHPLPHHSRGVCRELGGAEVLTENVIDHFFANSELLYKKKIAVIMTAIFFGGATGTRTPDPLLAKQVL